MALFCTIAMIFTDEGRSTRRTEPLCAKYFLEVEGWIELSSGVPIFWDAAAIPLDSSKLSTDAESTKWA